MVPLGTEAPSFSLYNPVTEETDTLNDLRGEVGTVVMFICNHCPYVRHYQQELVRLAIDYMPKGISFVAINSNDAEQYPDDSPERMVEDAERFGYPFSYLYDVTQETARAYDATCTPDFFLFDENLKLVYRGQLDDSRPQNGLPVTARDLRGALDALLNGGPIAEDQKPSLGCGIKWKELAG